LIDEAAARNRPQPATPQPTMAYGFKTQWVSGLSTFKTVQDVKMVKPKEGFWRRGVRTHLPKKPNPMSPKPTKSLNLTDLLTPR
jgi:hypothetical protein